MTPCPPELVAFAHALGDIATDLIRQHARGPISVETKADGSPVTDVDRAVETAIRQEIHRQFPAHGVIGEEFPAERADADFVWIIDPLDGTKEFIQGLPLFGTLIALAHRGQIVLGLAEQPLTRDRWLGADGHGTTWKGVPVRTRACERLDRAVLSTMGYDSFCRHRQATLAPLRGRCGITVTGDSFFVFGLLAGGRVDAIVSDGFALHDYAALDAIVRNAGGSMTDWRGQPLSLTSDKSVVAVGDTRLLADILPALATA
jgi:inositol-phosphate phosphatase / L-galactose 1-phosphate phosphatase / histidinol-phosphatase